MISNTIKNVLIKTNILMIYCLLKHLFPNYYWFLINSSINLMILIKYSSQMCCLRVISLFQLIYLLYYLQSMLYYLTFLTKLILFIQFKSLLLLLLYSSSLFIFSSSLTSCPNFFSYSFFLSFL